MSDHLEVLAAPSPVVAGQYGYRSQAVLVSGLSGLLVLQTLMQGLNAAACLVLAQNGVDLGLARKALLTSRALASVASVSHWFTLLAFGTFLVISNKNARAFASADADTETEPEEPESWDEEPEIKRASIWRFSPASMIWWFAVPLLNFIRPYHAVKAVWECSAPKRAGAAALHQNVLWPWWAAWLVWELVQQASVALTSQKLTGAERNTYVAVTGLTAAVSAALALRMVRGLDARQRQRASELWG